MTKRCKCPNKESCGRVEDHKVMEYFESTTNIDHASHWYIVCKNCGHHFNIWECTEDKIKEMFGENYKNYL